MISKWRWFKGLATWKKVLLTGSFGCLISFLLVIALVLYGAYEIRYRKAKCKFKPVAGRVIDSLTKEPVGDAFLKYRMHCGFIPCTVGLATDGGGIHESKSAMTRTDDQGHYRLAGWKYIGHSCGGLYEKNYDVRIFKPGYLLYSEQAGKNKTNEMVPYPNGVIPCGEWPELKKLYCTTEKGGYYGPGGPWYVETEQANCDELNAFLDRTHQEIIRLDCDYNLAEAIDHCSEEDARVILDRYPHRALEAGLLHRAAREECPPIAELLIINGAEVNTALSSYETPLHIAASTRRPEMVRILIDAGADVNRTDQLRNTPLIYAAKGGINDYGTARMTIEVIDLLVDHGADINQPGADGAAPLHYLPSFPTRDTGVIEHLIERGADVNAKGKDGRTPLHEAVSTSLSHSDYYINEEHIEVLIAHGASVNAVNDKGDTPLHNARDLKEIQTLLDHGADIQIRNEMGRTPFFWIAQSDCQECIIKMIAAGADLNTRDRDGNTPLHSLSGCDGTYPYTPTEFLLSLGADPNVRNATGQTPLDIAKSQTMKQILIAHGGRPGQP